MSIEHEISAIDRSVIVLSLILAGISVATADTYRWRDADGTTHFSDQPPPVGVPVEKITVSAQPSPLSAEEATQAVARLRAAEVDRQAAAAAAKDAAAAAAATAGAEGAAKRDRCARAQWALSALETARPVYRDGDGMYRLKRPPGQADAYTGPRDYLDDPSRAREIVAQQKLVQDNCGALPTAEQKAEIENEIRNAEHCEAAAADLDLLTRDGHSRDTDLINARREFLDKNCTPRGK